MQTRQVIILETGKFLPCRIVTDEVMDLRSGCSGMGAHDGRHPVFDNHLPFERRWCWALLERLLSGVGVPIMRKLKL
jgi:hypothetical protein